MSRTSRRRQKMGNANDTSDCRMCVRQWYLLAEPKAAGLVDSFAVRFIFSLLQQPPSRTQSLEVPHQSRDHHLSKYHTEGQHPG